MITGPINCVHRAVILVPLALQLLLLVCHVILALLGPILAINVHAQLANITMMEQTNTA